MCEGYHVYVCLAGWLSMEYLSGFASLCLRLTEAISSRAD